MATIAVPDTGRDEGLCDVVLLWHLVERLDLVNILDQATAKREHGQSVGLMNWYREC